jgi:hypothetical protein
VLLQLLLGPTAAATQTQQTSARGAPARPRSHQHFSAHQHAAEEPRAMAPAPRSHGRQNSTATDISDGRASTSSLPPALLRTPTRQFL